MHAHEVYWTLEGDLLHTPMPENYGLWSQARSSSSGQTFIYIAWRNLKCLIRGTRRLIRHL